MEKTIEFKFKVEEGKSPIYEVNYNPPIPKVDHKIEPNDSFIIKFEDSDSPLGPLEPNGLYGIKSQSFPRILLDTLDGLLRYNRLRDPVRVTVHGIFPERDKDMLLKLFDLYARAQRVKVEHQAK